jgi:predicted nucleic acid-binding protein
VIVVDTSVWIDVLNNRATRQAKHCAALIEDGQPVALTDVIFTEILQGISSVDDAARVERHLRAFPILRLSSLDDFALAGIWSDVAVRHGAYFHPWHNWFLSGAHTDADIDAALAATDPAFAAVAAAR